MATLDHSRRVRLQTTLCAIDVRRESSDGRTLSDPGPPVTEQAAILRALSASADEVRWLVSHVEGESEKHIAAALGATDPLALPTAIREQGSKEAIHVVVQALISHRIAAINGALTALTSSLAAAETAWADAEALAQTDTVAADPEQAKLERVRRLMSMLEQQDRVLLEERLRAGLHALSDAFLAELEAKLPSDAVPAADDAASAALLSGAHALFLRGAAFDQQPRSLRIRAALGSAHVPHEHKQAIRSALQSLGLQANSPTFDQEWQALVGKRKQLEDLAAARPEPPPSPLSPIGYLHLERLSHAPAGIEHGELLYSLPLAPGERVAIVHKEWSNTEEEFHKLVADQFEDYSERGVVDKTDMAEATETQRTHATVFSVAVTGSGGLGPMNTSVATSFVASDMDMSSRKASLTHSQTLTKKASARARKEHRTSFRLAKKTHVEDQTVRWVKNPDPIHPVRYDYYQLLRKWRVDLRRYGVRLTYDLTIPQPAVDLLGIYRELWQLDVELEKGFTFDLSPGSVTRTNWRALAEQYGASVQPPPPLIMAVQSAKLLGPYPADDPNRDHVDELRVAVPEGYTFHSFHGKGLSYSKDPESLFPGVIVHKLHDGNAPIFEMVFGVYATDVRLALASVRVWFQLGPEAENAWRLSAFNALAEAANKAYLERRQMLEARRAHLLGQLEQMDALTLRKLEREELMKGVLRWLFGSKIDFAPAVAGPLYDADGTVLPEVQPMVLHHGRLISFVHQAIEWENLNYFLYPYFWTHASTWADRLRLHASEPVHEAFLRSGAARVVLPVRPGWERAFLTFMATGAIDATLPDDHAYMTIAEEIENYAKTNYPGIVPANPDEVDPDKATEAAEGILIGSWHEYTPTSGVDIKVGESAPTEGVFAPPAFQPESGAWAKLGPLVDALEGFIVALTQKVVGGGP